MSFDTAFYHHLTNAFLGAAEALDVKPDGNGRLAMRPKGAHSGQLWKLVKLGGGKYALRTAYLDDCFSLDVFSKGQNHFPRLAATGDYRGQAWTLTPWGDGTYRLTNDSTGLGQSLDTTGDTHEPILAPGDQSGQHWMLTPARKIEGHAAIPPLDPGRNEQPNEGPTDFANLYIRPEGVVRAVMIFVEFPNALAGAASPADLARHLLGNGMAQKLFAEQSHRRLALDVTVEARLGWRKMSKDTVKYTTHNFVPHRDYIAEAVGLFSADVDFSNYSLVLIVTPELADLKGASAFTAPKGSGATAPSGEIRLAVTFDGSTHKERYTTLVHEVSHLFGLPDLYPATGSADDSKAGCWAMMSDIFHAAGFLGWHLHKNGWLDDSRKAYVTGDRAGWSATLHPLSGTCGLSMVVLPIDDAANPSKVFVVELAQTVLGTNGEYFGEGALLYTVDATIPTQQSPVVIVPRKSSFSPVYGNLFEAPCVSGDTVTHSEGKASITLTVAQRFGSSFEVRIDYKEP
ncbi:MAG TPA: hypothetical protein VF173_02380 [Thermoanaerobaculia bacterium]|nr:hypothetical protein [Thermoanaerobaculia bacterium]